jgi:hypothetical protein
MLNTPVEAFSQARGSPILWSLTFEAATRISLLLPLIQWGDRQWNCNPSSRVQSHSATENMPTDFCQYIYDCKGCGYRMKPSRASTASTAPTGRSLALRSRAGWLLPVRLLAYRHRPTPYTYLARAAFQLPSCVAGPVGQDLGGSDNLGLNRPTDRPIPWPQSRRTRALTWPSYSTK